MGNPAVFLCCFEFCCSCLSLFLAQALLFGLAVALPIVVFKRNFPGIKVRSLTSAQSWAATFVFSVGIFLTTVSQAKINLVLCPDEMASLEKSTVELPWTSKDAAQFLKRFVDIGSLESRSWDWEGLYQRVEKTTQFKDFAKGQGVDIKTLSYEERTTFIHDYVAHFLRRYLPESLESLQDAELTRSLKAHGAAIGKGESGRQALERISKDNLQRLLSPDDLNHPAYAPELVEAVNGMRIFFLHNTAKRTEKTNVPLLSSDEIRDLGVGQNLQNTKRFNRKFLKTSGNVFSFANFTAKTGVLPRRLSETYGSYPIYIDPAYMRDHGWVSSFVMYPTELLGTALHNTPAIARFAVSPFWPISTLLKRPLRNRLSRLDFTVADFETLVRTKLLTGLSRLDPHSNEYRSALYLLNAEIAYPALKSILNKFVYTPLNIPTSGLTSGYTPFEGKVPVAIPTQYLTFEAR